MLLLLLILIWECLLTNGLSLIQWVRLSEYNESMF